MTDTDRPVVVLAFDFGLKHIGVACGQSLTGTANPITTLSANVGKPRFREVQALIEQWLPDRLLVGLPLNMDDSESPISQGARGFAQRLSEQTQLPVWLVDERLSSREAIDEQGADPLRSHALAAVVIAERYFREPDHAVMLA
ncbi:MAG: Holliday junction resolvase RuvX [Pseudomonadales bacterium]